MMRRSSRGAYAQGKLRTEYRHNGLFIQLPPFRRFLLYYSALIDNKNLRSINLSEFLQTVDYASHEISV